MNAGAFRCYLCSSTAFRKRKGSVRDDASLEILECTGCGLVTLSSLAHIRPGHYEDSGMHGDDTATMQAWLRLTDSDDERRFQMLKSAMVNRRVLDFGSGASGFIRKAMSVASHVTGVEPERRVRDHWKDSLLLCASLDEAEKDYDLITAFHVVEHLAQPREMLASLGEHLADNGRLVIEVPSSEDALLTLYDNDAFQRFTYWSQHLFLFNAETLRRLALSAGLRVVSIQQHQRYPLSNHLYWLSQGKPGGHARWDFLDSKTLSDAYAASLAAIGKCDTLIAFLERDTTSSTGQRAP